MARKSEPAGIRNGPARRTLGLHASPDALNPITLGVRVKLRILTRSSCWSSLQLRAGRVSAAAHRAGARGGVMLDPRQIAPKGVYLRGPSSWYYRGPFSVPDSAPNSRCSCPRQGRKQLSQRNPDSSKKEMW